MHIMLTNDDGPPSAQVSPYLLPFVNALEAAGHIVSVIVPDGQRSWIGKAHMIGQDVQTRLYWPPSTTPEVHDSSPSSNNKNTTGKRPWVLVNSTPASCSQLGINGPFFKGNDLPPIDLVVSGPNFGRNTTAVFALSSGTLGAALEASVCGQRAVALSFAYFRQEPNWNDPAAVLEACDQGVRVCEYLARSARWEKGLLYSVNVPVKVGVKEKRVLWTKMLSNQWTQGGCFQEVESAAAESNGEGSQVQHFKWAPRFQDVYDSVLRAGPGSDGWAVKEGETSVTALMANFMPAEGFSGEVKL